MYSRAVPYVLLHHNLSMSISPCQFQQADLVCLQLLLLILLLLLWKWQTYICYWKCEWLLICHKLQSLHRYQIYYFHLISWPCHQRCKLKWVPLCPSGCIFSVSCHAACFYDSMSKAWVVMVYLSGLRINASFSPSICWIWKKVSVNIRCPMHNHKDAIIICHVWKKRAFGSSFQMWYTLLLIVFANGCGGNSMSKYSCFLRFPLA